MAKPLSIQQSRKQFERLFNNAFLFRRDKFDGWSDWLTITSCATHQGLYWLGMLEPDELFQMVGEELAKTQSRHSPEQLGHFRQLTETIAYLIQHGYDLMGDLFQLLELYNPHAGQFFTPPDVAKLLVRIGMDDLKEKIETYGRVTIADHACGSGGLLLAAADYIESLGYNPKEVAVFEGIDIDRDCFNMAYIQLSLRGLQAVIHHGNTLTLKINETRCTPMLRMYQCWQWEMAQQRQKHEGMDRAFALLGSKVSIPFEPVPFMQWHAMPKSRLGLLGIDLDELDDEPRTSKARSTSASKTASPSSHHQPGGGRSQDQAMPVRSPRADLTDSIMQTLETVTASVDEAVEAGEIIEDEAQPKPKPKSRKRNRIQINPDVEQLNLFDL